MVTSEPSQQPAVIAPKLAQRELTKQDLQQAYDLGCAVGRSGGVPEKSTSYAKYIELFGDHTQAWQAYRVGFDTAAHLKHFEDSTRQTPVPNETLASFVSRNTEARAAMKRAMQLVRESLPESLTLDPDSIKMHATQMGIAAARASDKPMVQQAINLRFRAMFGGNAEASDAYRAGWNQVFPGHATQSAESAEAYQTRKLQERRANDHHTVVGNLLSSVDLDLNKTNSDSVK